MDQLCSEAEEAARRYFESEQLPTISLLIRIKHDSLTLVQVLNDLRNVLQISVDLHFFVRFKPLAVDHLRNNLRRRDGHLEPFSTHPFDKHSQVQISSSPDRYLGTVQLVLLDL